MPQRGRHVHVLPHMNLRAVVLQLLRMAMTWDTFERFKQKGLDARRAGQWESARVYLLEAAGAMMELSKSAPSADLTAARREMARRLLELARDCQTAKGQGRRPPPLSDRAAVTADETAQGGHSASEWLVRDRPAVRFADVAGLEEVKQEIRLKMIYPFEHADLAKKFDIRPGGGVLLYGPPGTGKTLLARATAGEINAAFFRISAADVLSKWVGEAEQNIQKLFAAAAAEQRSIIFIDEIESLIPARRDDGSSVMQRVVPQILQEIEGFDKKEGRSVLFMGATNVPWQLDPAVLRPGRFDEKIFIPLPDAEARWQLLQIHLAHRPLDPNVNLRNFADGLDGYSGADVKYICDRAVAIPFLENIAGGAETRITQAILDQTVRETGRSVTDGMINRFEEWAKSA